MAPNDATFPRLADGAVNRPPAVAPGGMQSLGMFIGYVPELPLIDEIVRGMEEVAINRPPELPPQYAEVLIEKAAHIWHDAPWRTLSEHQIISIEINQDRKS